MRRLRLFPQQVDVTDQVSISNGINNQPTANRAQVRAVKTSNWRLDSHVAPSVILVLNLDNK